MDDIIVSSKSEAKLSKAMLQIEKAAAKSRFDFHPEKTEGPAPIVTAFNIELAQGDLSIAPTRLLQFIDAYRTSDSSFQRNGISGYVNSINPLQVAELL